MIVMRLLASRYVTMLDELEIAGQRQLLAQNVVYDVHSLSLMNRGWLPDTANVTQQHLHQVVDELESVHDVLYLSSER